MSLFDDLGGRGGYLLLLVLTFALHALLIGFVLGAAAWATVRALRGGDDPIAGVSRDWLPFGLGAAITAGVAPLLLVQVLYQHRMYTATLLLSHRFMAIVPVLIAGFYLLYLGKSERVQAWNRVRRLLVHGGALAAFVFVAWTWIEEHTLASASPEVWVAHYAEGRLVHRDPVIAQRLVVWLGLAGTAYAVGTAWLGGTLAGNAGMRRLGAVGLGGLTVALGGAGALAWTYGNDVAATAGRAVVLAALAVVAAGFGFLLLAGGKLRAGRRLATAGVIVLFVAVSAIRESMRAHRVEWRGTLDGAQGLPLFLLFVVLGVVAIVWCARLVRRHLDRV